MFPELGPRVGHAVTCVYGLPDSDRSDLSFSDVIEALDASPKPTILALQQQFPQELADRVGLAGEIMVTSMRAVGCVGLLSDGPSRDIDAVRALDFQCLLAGVTAGHGDMAVHAVNVPVTVGGLDVAPGDVIHMDENGACKFPAEKLEAVLNNATELLKNEQTMLEALRRSRTATEVRAALESQAYAIPGE